MYNIHRQYALRRGQHEAAVEMQSRHNRRSMPLDHLYHDPYFTEHLLAAQEKTIPIGSGRYSGAKYSETLLLPTRAGSIMEDTGRHRSQYDALVEDRGIRMEFGTYHEYDDHPNHPSNSPSRHPHSKHHQTFNYAELFTFTGEKGVIHLGNGKCSQRQ